MLKFRFTICAFCSHKAGVNPEEGFFSHEVYSDDIFFRLAEAAISFLGKPGCCVSIT